METLRSYIAGQWVEGSGPPSVLVDPTTEQPVAQTSAAGLDLAGGFAHGRAVGGPALRSMTFAARGAMLSALAEAIVAERSSLLELSMANNGATRGDAKFDVDGASFALAAYAELGAELGDRRYQVDGEPVELLRSRRLGGLHIKTPYRGVACHVNAFNFPAWGLAEKAAVAWLAGMPVVTKPATATSWTAYAMARALVDTGVLPDGAFTFLAGHPDGLVDHLTTGDVLAFTGSSQVGQTLRSLPHVVARGIPVNIEADSVNAVVVGPDIGPGDDAWDQVVRDVFREITQKAGQKCTATRRVFVPVERKGDMIEGLIEQAERLKIGNPFADGVRMGPLVSARQLRDVRAGIDRFGSVAQLAYGSGRPQTLHGVEDGKGFFVDVHLFSTADPAASLAADVVHAEEVFGPVATVLPYDGTVSQAAELVALGRGGLVASLYSDDRTWRRDLALELAPWHGRITLGGSKVADIAPGPGAVLPQLVHGGPGRAGGGEELGGLRGMDLYLQRTAIQGYRPLVERLFDGG